MHEEARWRIVLFVGSLVFALSMAGMGAGAYWTLRVPHGDSGMYEEHLWNLMHGKGFRSQLDDGRLFLGEHFQLIHLIYLPIYFLFPSFLTLLILQAMAVATVPWSVASIARSHGASQGAASVLGLATLLYFPLQMLLFEESWKCFRPETLGVPLLVAGLACLEGGRRRLGLALICLTWLVKEDYTIVTASLGIYFACRPTINMTRICGVGLASVSLAVFALLVGVVIPYFRDGEPVHYSPYFSELGTSPGAILVTLVREPGRLLAPWLTPTAGGFLLLLLGPLALLPLASPGRLVVAAPVLQYLLLGEREGMASPFFHFHGPLVPILLWAAAAGLGRFAPTKGTGRTETESGRQWWPNDQHIAGLVLVACFTTGLWFGRSPLSLGFYLPSGLRAEVEFTPTGRYWRDVLWPDERSTRFADAVAHVLPEDRVASTDFIRPRFIYARAAFDYPNLRAHVDPAEVDVLVLDKTEGWWGRGETNPDRELLLALRANRSVGAKFLFRGEPFRIAHHDRYFFVARKVVKEEE